MTSPAVLIILFFVMSDITTLSKIGHEEIFEGDAAARAEFDLYCDELNNEAIAAQDAEMTEHELKMQADVKMLALVDRLKAQVESLRAENKTLEKRCGEWQRLCIGWKFIINIKDYKKRKPTTPPLRGVGFFVL